MHGKEFVLDCLRTFFVVVTLINLAMFILGRHFMPENQFGYEAFAVPVIYGLVGTFPNLVMYSKRELKVSELIIRKILQLILIETGVLFVAFYNSEEQSRTTEIMVSTAISIFVIYVLSTVFDWLHNYLAAKNMNEDLLRFQGSIRE